MSHSPGSSRGRSSRTTPAGSDTGCIGDRVVDVVTGRAVEVAGAGHEAQHRAAARAVHAAGGEVRLGPALDALHAEAHDAAVAATDGDAVATPDGAQPVEDRRAA